MFLTLLNLIGYSISSNSVFPPIGNIYKSDVKLPFVGNQYIEYKRFEETKSYIYLSGIVNCNCTMNINNVVVGPKNMYYFSLDYDVIERLKKYKCYITEPTYDMVKDIITFKISLIILNLNKRIILRKDY